MIREGSLFKGCQFWRPSLFCVAYRSIVVPAYEHRSPEVVEPYLGKLKRNKASWKFFEAQPPSYREVMNWWVVSAKREETRLKRIERLIEESAQGTTHAVNENADPVDWSEDLFGVPPLGGRRILHLVRGEMLIELGTSVP